MPSSSPARTVPARPSTQLRQHFWWLALVPPLLALAGMSILFTVDRSALMLTLQAMTRSLPDTVWAALTLLGNGAMVCACLALGGRRRPDWLIAGLCALPFAALYSRAFKLGVDSPRPAAILPLDQLHIVGERLLQHSFPSGHTVTAFVAAAVILLAARPPRIAAAAALLLAILVGLSRIAVGAHWPTDVLAGAAGGWLAGAIGVALANRWTWAHSKRAELLAAATTLIASLALFAVNIGYVQAIAFKFLIAGLGTLAAAHWLYTRWRTC